MAIVQDENGKLMLQMLLGGGQRANQIEKPDSFRHFCNSAMVDATETCDLGKLTSLLNKKQDSPNYKNLSLFQFIICLTLIIFYHYVAFHFVFMH